MPDDDIKYLPNAMETEESPKALMFQRNGEGWYSATGKVPVHPGTSYNINIKVAHSMFLADLVEMLKGVGEDISRGPSVLVEIPEDVTIHKIKLGEGWGTGTLIVIAVYGTWKFS